MTRKNLLVFFAGGICLLSGIIIILHFYPVILYCNSSEGRHVLELWTNIRQKAEYQQAQHFTSIGAFLSVLGFVLCLCGVTLNKEKS